MKLIVLVETQLVEDRLAIQKVYIHTDWVLILTSCQCLQITHLYHKEFITLYPHYAIMCTHRLLGIPLNLLR